MQKSLLISSFLLFLIFLLIVVLSANVKATHMVYAEDKGDYWSGESDDLYYNDSGYVFRVAGTSGISVYQHNVAGETLDYITSNPTESGSTSYKGITENDSYYHVAGSNRVLAYTFDGSTLSLAGVRVDGAHAIYADGSYIYHDSDKIYALNFDGTTYTVAGSVDYAADTVSDIYGDETYIYIVYESYGMRAYTFDGSTFVNVGNFSSGSGVAQNVHCSNGYIFYARGSSAYILTFDGSTFTQIDTYSGTYPREARMDESGTYLIAGASDGGTLDTKMYIFEDGELSCQKQFDRMTRALILIGNMSDGQIAYLIDGQGELYHAFGTNYSENIVNVSGSMPDSWYNRRNNVSHWEYALSNVADNGTIYVWNGSYTEPELENCVGQKNKYIYTNNLSVIGNNSASVNITHTTYFQVYGHNFTTSNITYIVAQFYLKSSAYDARMDNCTIDGYSGTITNLQSNRAVLHNIYTKDGNHGFYISGSYNELYNCRATGSLILGTVLLTGHYNIVSGFDGTSALLSGKGFYISGDFNTILNCTLSDRFTSSYALDLRSGSNGNLIYNNYFDISNSGLRDRGTNNLWNLTKTLGTNIIGGPYLGGNYWSDYVGNDVDGDGLGDESLPYSRSGAISTGGDYHPLVEATLNADFDYYPAEPYIRETITFLDKSTGYVLSWSWEFGDGTTSTDKNPEHSYAKAGKYTVTLLVRNLTATDQCSKTITVNMKLVGPSIPELMPVNFPLGYTIEEIYRIINGQKMRVSNNPVKIVVMDSGVYPRNYNNVTLNSIINKYHPYFSDGIDEYGHGTFVNYEIAYLLQLKAPNAIQISYRAFESDGTTTEKIFLESIDNIKQLKPDVVTISAGIIGHPNDVYSKKIKELHDMGIIVVTCAAGNYGPALSSIISPGLCSYAIAVGATDPVMTIPDPYDDVICLWSSRGPITGIDENKPDIVAPGESIRGPWLNGNIVISGTSLATPLVAAGTCVIVSEHKLLIDIVKTLYFLIPGVVPDAYEDALEKSCISKGDSTSGGAGLIQLDEISHHFFINLIILLIIYLVVIAIIIIAIILIYIYRDEIRDRLNI